MTVREKIEAATKRIKELEAEDPAPIISVLECKSKWELVMINKTV